MLRREHPAAHAAEPRGPITSGGNIDGLGVASLKDPQATADGAVALIGAETRLTLGGRTFNSGDPLPAPLVATFEEILQGQVSETVAGLLTVATGPEVAAAILVVEDGAAIAFTATLAGGRDVLARWRDGRLRPLAVEGRRVRACSRSAYRTREHHPARHPRGRRRGRATPRVVGRGGMTFLGDRPVVSTRLSGRGARRALRAVDRGQ